MKEGSFDIPAFKFLAICGDELNENGRLFLDWGAKSFSFEQVDGLTVRQFLNFFNDNKKSKFIGIDVLLDVTNVYTPKGFTHHYTPVMTVITRVRKSNLDLEISELIETTLLNLLNLNKVFIAEDFNPSDIISTFCARYRGRDKEFINQKVKRIIKDNN